ncbi:hypothetical protein DFH29DRAFT_956042 [Suillus ampliporus]|nr:hypothetical protein DFH29DRAFT_956042 [Suillus ampliporus]
MALDSFNLYSMHPHTQMTRHTNRCPLTVTPTSHPDIPTENQSPPSTLPSKLHQLPSPVTGICIPISLVVLTLLLSRRSVVNVSCSELVVQPYLQAVQPCTAQLCIINQCKLMASCRSFSDSSSPRGLCEGRGGIWLFGISYGMFLVFILAGLC